MTHVRRPLIAALALFTVAIGLDRTGIGAGSDVVGTHAYAIAAAALLSPMIVVGLRRTRTGVAVATAIGVLMGYSILFGAGFFGDAAPHIAAIEMSFVALAAGLGHALAVSLDRLDELIEVVAVGESPAIDLEGPLAANEIHTEVARSRRHDRPLSVTVLSPTTHGLEGALERASIEVTEAIRTRFLFGTLARTVAGVLRRSDLLFEHRPTGRLVVLSPETDSDGTSLLVERILSATAANGIETIAGTASFPSDGIGFETLIDEAERSMNRAAEAPRLRAVEQGGTR